MEIIETRWEEREGFQYEQPYQYFRGVKITYKNIDKFEDIFGVSFNTVKRNTFYYNEALRASSYDSNLWINNDIRDKSFNIVFKFIKEGMSGTGSSATPLLPFEIFMLNDGFEMVSFSEMNAINPSFTLVCDKKIGEEIHNPKSFYRSRFYEKNDLRIYLSFGMTVKCGTELERLVHFYFKTNNSFDCYEVDNRLEKYQDAINGKLPSL